MHLGHPPVPLVFALLLCLLPHSAESATLHRVSWYDNSIGTHQEYAPSWAPAGDSIATHTEVSFGEGFIRFTLIWTAVQAPHVTIAGSSEQPDWSMDGSKIVLRRNGLSAAQNGIWVYSRLGGDPVKVSDSGFSASWHPNSIDLVFVENSQNLWRINTDTGVRSQVTSHIDREVAPAWSPDGARVAFASNRTGNWDIWVIDVTTAVETQITTDPSTDTDPTWSPDGNWLAFTSWRSGNADIWVRDSAAMGTAAQITTDPAEDLEPDWSPTGNAIAFTSNRASADWGFRIWVVEGFALSDSTVAVSRETFSDVKSRFRE